MSGLSKKDFDYFVRTIMPELYERKAKKDAFMEHLLDTLPEAFPEVPIPMIHITEPYAAEKRLSA